ncbi:hypothetical protein NADFUDRAFT_51904 [Nadsonia fulvescens var. elongata DSM 6958]|uniref:Major facilitator superfamily (MFS) profile domain-containing protein n=1 Tax=Nadsonia fulvescens var. elongata DSM 6958 TaxID=857566 RepID=A0A1E3PK46_9ASCO|nr:hypothetical protein NADFUDRAFT_51904 [Nadsonia fulvescens var. elongata DSM 6958]
MGYNVVWAPCTTEIFPTHMRVKSMTISPFGNYAMQIVLSQISPIALGSVGWKYYLVFASCNIVLLALFCTCFPETKGRTLKDMNEIFGDVVIKHVVPLDNLEKPTSEKDEFIEFAHTAKV